MFKAIILPLVLFSAVLNTAAQSITSTRIDMRLEKASISEALRRIEAVTPFHFIANADDIENGGLINIDVKNESIEKILSRIFKGTRLTFRQNGTNILVRKNNRNVAAAGATAAQSRTVHGTITSSTTGETIIGATVSVVGTAIGTLSNDYGFFSLAVPSEYQMILITAIGMESLLINIDTVGANRMRVLLSKKDESLEAVTITAAARGNSLRSPQMSMERLSAEQIKNVPVIFGERDIMKTIQLLPGVKSAGEGNSGFYVRGGAADQNLVLLDEAPVYNASHLLGFFSTFNSDAIKNVTLYKGGMPPQYGGRLSSVVDVKMNDGNNKDFGVSGGIGLIASRLNIEGPVQKERSSFMISGRRTYADIFLKLLGDSSLRSAQL